MWLLGFYVAMLGLLATHQSKRQHTASRTITAQLRIPAKLNTDSGRT
jgi:hypothetical protein